MTKKESDRLKELFQQRSRDFWPAEAGEFDPKAWRRYLKKINVRMIEDDEVCVVFNNRNDNTVLVENPHMGLVWMTMPKELALKSLVLGELPPRYSNKPAKKG